MFATRLCTFSYRHLAWLLWFALLLPLGQTAATWHVLSHTDPSHSDADDGKQGIHQDHCELCLCAAALIAGAPPLASSGPSLTAVRVDVPRLELHGILSSAPILAYHSRAPPVSMH